MLTSFAVSQIAGGRDGPPESKGGPSLDFGNLVGSLRQVNRFLLYGLVSTLIITFAAIGTLIAAFFVPEYALVGLLLGSTLGTMIALNDATIFGCLAGMLVGLVLGVPTFLIIDFETAYMVVFAASLLGAVMGQPMASALGSPGPASDTDRADGAVS